MSDRKCKVCGGRYYPGTYDVHTRGLAHQHQIAQNRRGRSLRPPGVTIRADRPDNKSDLWSVTVRVGGIRIQSVYVLYPEVESTRRALWKKYGGQDAG